MARTIAPISRRLRADEIASGILFLCLPASSAMMGEILIVDGGAAIK